MAILISRNGFGLQFVRNKLTSATVGGNSKRSRSLVQGSILVPGLHFGMRI